ncbi:MAG: TonB-dependent receptor [Bacteroides sp.]|nr:TonB-dependent receptor [Bacteroides sp.]
MTRKFFFLLILLWSSALSFSQTASLSGKITDSDTNRGLPGVNIILKSTGHGSITGQHGDYLLKDIPPGEHVVLFSFMGYESIEKALVFEANKTLSLDIEMVPGSIDLSAVTIEARRPFSAASSKAVRDFDLKVRPVRSAQELLQMVPGLIIAQHAGGGKAEQIFMRGFDADHGTDVGVYVDGMPVNMVTHGHGQGYADLHFIIPEIIDGLEVFKGPYFGRFGNFGTAGSVSMSTTDHPDHNLVKLEGGMFSTVKATTVLKIPTEGTHQSAYIAGQYFHSDGAVENPQGFNRANIFGKFHTHLSPKSELGLSMGAFSSAWNASGQIPQRAVEDGQITRWGSIDPLEGGNTGRYNISVDYHYMEGYEHDFQIQAFATTYDFRLYSNFTFWLNDSINGDMIEQNDHRQIMGINARYSYYKSLGKVKAATRVGGSYRGDHIDLSLWKSPDRIRMSPRTDHSVVETNMAFWVEEELTFSRLFRMQFGLRGDYFVFDVTDNLDPALVVDDGLPHGSGYEQAGILSPNLNLVLSPISWLDIYLNGGTGFHSNDARDVIYAQGSGLKTLPRASGAELGLRLGSGRRFLLTMAGWYLHLEEELVFVGDEGTTEASGETRRVGIDAEFRLQLAKWMWADVDLNLSNGRYVDEPEGENYIALAPRVSSQGGINFRHPSGFEGAFRYRFIGDRPANEDNSIVARGYFIGNVILAYRIKGFRIFAQLENMLNTQWNEAQFDTESRLFNEPASVSEINFTPGNPLNVQAGISLEF